MPDNQKNVYLTVENSSQHVVETYFDSAEEALAKLPVRELGRQHTLYLGFKPPFNIDSLKALSDKLDQSELVIFLQGNPSFSESEKTDIYQKALALANNRLGNLHIFLLNRHDNQAIDPFKINALGLASRPGKEPFTLLLDNKGYYLSSQDLFATIFNNKQHHGYLIKDTDDLQQSQTALDALQLRLQQDEEPEAIYLTAKAAPDAIRPLKTANKQQIKQHLQYRVDTQVVVQQNHNQAAAINQNQALTEQQTESQTQALNQNVNNKRLFPEKAYYSWEDFDKRLLEEAIRQLDNEHNSYSNLSCKGYLLANAPNLYWRIKNDNTFRHELVSHIYGGTYPSELDHFFGRTPSTIRYMSKSCAETIIKNLPYFMDNFYLYNHDEDRLFYCFQKINCEKFRTERIFGFHRGLIYVPTPPIAARSEHRHYSPSNLQNHRVMPLLSGLPVGFERHLQPYALLDEQSMQGIDCVKKQKITAVAQRLLSLFSNPRFVVNKDLKAVQSDFFALIQLYFPDKQQEYCSLLTQLLNPTEDITNTYKILLHVPIVGGRALLEKVLTMLQMLDQKRLLPYFSRYFLERQHDILSLSDIFIKQPTYDNNRCLKNTFLELARITPAGGPEKWPAFYKFYHYYLFFLSCHHIDTTESVQDFETHWEKTKSKFLNYTQQNEEKAQQLLERLTTNLIGSYGFNVRIQSYSADILAKLDRVIDAAIQNNTLEEQIDNIGYISLSGTDAPYALKVNGFKVVTGEMFLDLSNLAYDTDKFSLTLHEFEKGINQSISSFNLLQTLFRYLGGVEAREPLDYYRQLYIQLKDTELGELLMGWMVARSTGPYYNPSQPVKESLLELQKILIAEKVCHNDTAAALRFFNHALPACYDFQSIALLLQLVKTDLHNFDPERFSPLIPKIKQWHSRYDSQLIDLFELLAQRPDGEAIFKATLANPEQADQALEKLMADNQEALALIQQRRTASLQTHSTTLFRQLTQYPDLRALLKDDFQNLPPILLKPFYAANIANFIQMNNTAIIAAIKTLEERHYRQSHYAVVGWIYSHFTKTSQNRESWINRISTLICDQVLNATIKASFANPAELPILELVTTLYPTLTIDSLASEITNIERLIANISQLATLLKDKLPGHSPIIICQLLTNLFTEIRQTPTAIALTDLLLNTMSQHANKQEFSLLEKFISALVQHKQLLSLDQAQLLPVIQRLIDGFLANPCWQNCINDLLIISKKLLDGPGNPDVENLEAWLQMASSWQEEALISTCRALSTQHLRFFVENIVRLDDANLAKIYLTLVAKGNNEDCFNQLAVAFPTIHQAKKALILSISLGTCTETTAELPTLAMKLNELAPELLARIEKMVTQQFINLPALTTLLKQPDINQALDIIEKANRSRQLNNLDVDIAQVIQKIDEIKYKPLSEGEDVALDYRERKQILDDFVTVMALLKDKPIAVKTNATGVQQAVSIYDLSEQEFKALMQKCRQTLSSKTTSLDSKHQASLITLALSCVAMTHTLGKTPTYVQLLAQLNSINHSGNIIHEIPTGGGKSISGAWHAVWLWACGKTVTVTTCNGGLAARDAAAFNPFYNYLGIEANPTIITPDSPHGAYTKNAIHYSTGPNLALFIKNTRLKDGILPDNPAMVADEVDAALKTLVESRVAASIDPIFNEKKKWQFIYPTIMDFVNDAELFSKNHCSQADDVSNLRTYLKVKSRAIKKHSEKKDLRKFIDKLPEKLLNDCLDSAIVANGLEENVDYQIVTITKEKTKKGALINKSYHYAAPVLDSTKRPDSAISWSNFVQQLLHAKLNKQSKSPRFPYQFIQESHTEEIAVVSAKNLFDYFFLNNGRVIGLTATAGGLVETQEFYQQNKFTSFSHPSFHPDRCTILPLETAPNQDALYQQLFQKLITNAQQFPGQPVLLFMESAKIAGEFRDYLKAVARQEELQSIHATIGYFDGSEKEGQAEVNFIQDIGGNGHCTIATESLARGADPATGHPDGLFVINTCVNITADDLRQIRGRAARDGRPGKFLCLLNAAQLEHGIGETAQEKFTFLQKQLEAKKTQERLKLTPLNDIRDYVIENCYLALKNKADELYQRQQGLGSSLLNTADFYQALCSFNQKMEAYYQELSENDSDPETLKANLMSLAVDEFNTYLNQAFKDEELQGFQVIEPLVSLDKISALPATVDALGVKQLAVFSQLFGNLWQMIGNNPAVQSLHTIDNVLDIFKPFLDGEQNTINMLKLIGMLLFNSKYWESEKLKPYFGDNSKQHLAADLKNLFNRDQQKQKEQLVDFIHQYLQQTTTAIREQHWDALAWPNIDFQTTYDAALQIIGEQSTIAKYSVKACKALLFNPQGLFVKYIVIPLIKQFILWLANDLPPEQNQVVTELVEALDELIPVIANVVNDFRAGENWSQLTVNSLLEKLKPILNCEPVLKFLKTNLKDTSYSFLIPFLCTSSALPKVLAPYADLTLKKCLSTKNILQILVQMSQLQQFQNAIDGEPLREPIKKLSNFDAQFFEQCQPIGIIPFVQLLEIIAHPRFYEFLSAIPEGITWGTLRQWLMATGLIPAVGVNSTDPAIPAAAKTALESLKNYQQDRDRIAQQSRDSMATLKQQFLLTREKITTHLTRLAQQPMPRLAINHRAIKKEEAQPHFIVPLYLDTPNSQPAARKVALPAIPSVDEFISKPAVIQKHFEQVMSFAATRPSSHKLCNAYTTWLCNALLNPSLDFSSKKLLPEQILPFVNKLADRHDNQSRPALCELLKKTAIGLLKEYQQEWFISLDRRALVNQLLTNITKAKDSVSIQKYLIEAKKTIYTDDYQTDQSFFNRLFKRLRNSKGHSRLHDRLEVLSTTASTILLAEGNQNQYESCATSSFTTTVTAVLEQLDDNKLQQNLEKLAKSLTHVTTVQDQQYFMNAAYDAVATVDVEHCRPSVKILINSLTKANLLQRTVTNLDYIPTISLRGA